MLHYLRKIIPRPILSAYHKTLAVLAATVFGFPSEKMIIIGVTGTNGKSTTVSLIAKVLEASGYKVGATSTVLFKVAEREWLNDKKMTMLGRFQLQSLLRQMNKAGCRYAVIETSSQGIEQYRHLGINYDYVVFTNLTPEHIEAHAGFENYKRAKGKLFEHLTRRRRKLHDNLPPCPLPANGKQAGGLGKEGEQIQKVSVVNVDDEHAEYFLQLKADKKVKFALKNENADFIARNVEISKNGTQFLINGEKINLKLIGEFNVYNALAAIAIGALEDLNFKQIKSGLEGVKIVPGRMEFIDEGQPFDVLVDYAPEPAAMGKLYGAIQKIKKSRNQENKKSRNQEIEEQEISARPACRQAGADSPMAKRNQEITDKMHGEESFAKRIIHVLGSCGGGRDKARRPVLGKIAGENADIVIVTNEDPYDDDPLEIINAVATGVVIAGKKENEDLFKIVDRREAIEKAIRLAKPDDLVLITGKGAEQAMAMAGGKYIPWDDRKIVQECLKHTLTK